jgi:octopine/nopaline transport system permease protein
MDWHFLADAAPKLLAGLPLTLQLAVFSLCLGFLLAVVLAGLTSSSLKPISWAAKFYVEVFRGTPLLVQIFLIYYGLGQIAWLRESALWPFLSQAYWCGIVALSLNTSAYGSEIIRGAIAAVPDGEIEAARSLGMSGLLLRRRIVWPIALRYGLANYGNEAILMLKATSLTSVITLMEVTGIARKMIAETYRAFEIFIVAGAIYLALTSLIAIGLHALERRLNPHKLGLNG